MRDKKEAENVMFMKRDGREGKSSYWPEYYLQDIQQETKLVLYLSILASINFQYPILSTFIHVSFTRFTNLFYMAVFHTVKLKLSVLLLNIIRMRLNELHLASSITSVPDDVQYQLSRCFMNYAKDQLINKQSAIIIQSNLLIDTLNRKIASKSYEQPEPSNKQYCNPISSNTLDTLMTQQDQLPRTRQRPFTRRSGNGPQRVLNCDFNMNLALEDIKDNCSGKTFSTVTNLIQNYNKAKRGALNESKAQLNMSTTGIVRQKVNTDRSDCDQAIILTARNLKLQKQNQALLGKQKQLENQLQQVESKLQSMLRHSNLENYIIQKQKHLIKQQQKIQKIHKDIIRGLETTFIEEGCNRCCVLVKKIKDSLLKYKVCLEEDIESYKGMWNQVIKQERAKVQNKCRCCVNIIA